MTIIETMSPSSSTVWRQRGLVQDRSYGHTAQLRSMITFDGLFRTLVLRYARLLMMMILEAPISYDDVAENTYNTLVQQGS
jgi:hypothetical protein